MAIEIVVPRLGWSMDEGTFGEWLVEDGQRVAEGDMLFVLEGEKASQEIESFDAGVLHIPADAPQPGDAVAVGQRIAYLLAAGESPPTPDARSAGVEYSAPSSVKPKSQAGGPAARRRARAQDVTGASVEVEATAVEASGDGAAEGSGARLASSPRARRRAKELGVDWRRATGTGGNGRVRERDVVALAASRSRAQSDSTPPFAAGVHQPATRVRRAIAARMSAGANDAAPVTLTVKVIADGLVALRTRLKEEAATEAAPGVTDMLIQLAAELLPTCPALNACWRDDGVFVYDDVNIAFAVDGPDGLVAPVIPNAGRLPLAEIAARRKQLNDAARERRLSQDQMSGGTFTITNLGAFGVEFFTPIINLPQSAILGVGTLVREPVVRGEQLAAAHVLSLSLTFDHRVIDGAPAARWLQSLCAAIESLEAN